jgi:hypothetical protein
MTMVQLFNVSNLFVLPFWVLMILLPNWGITKKVMESKIPFVILALVYIYFFVGAITPESIQGLSSTQLSDLAQAFSDEKVMATGWTHYLVMDLFVGRWIYWEGQRTGIWTIHSLVLCLFAGPMGLLSHIVTDWIAKRFFQTTETEIAPKTATTES